MLSKLIQNSKCKMQVGLSFITRTNISAINSTATAPGLADFSLRFLRRFGVPTQVGRATPNHQITKSTIPNPSVPFRRIVMRPLLCLCVFVPTFFSLLLPLLLTLILWLTPGCGGSKSFTPAAPTGTVTGFLYTKVAGAGRVAGAGASAEELTLQGFIAERADARIAEAGAPAGYMPLVSASVTCASVTPVLTNTTGYFSLPNVPVGQQNCTATKAGYKTIAFTATVTGGQTAKLNDEGQIATGTVATPEKTGTLAVVSSPTGATIIIDSATLSNTTNTSLNTIAIGSYNVNVSLSNYETPSPNESIILRT